MKNLRRRFDRWCLKNRNKGIANLMLILGIGNVLVYLLTVIDPSKLVYSYLCFDRSAILSGQVWRLLSYIFTYVQDGGGLNILLSAVAFYCYYMFGKILEQVWGAFRFNLYYLCGVLLTDLGGMLLGYNVSAQALNLSLFLAVATIAPDAKVLLFFFIPVRFRIMAWVYLGLTAFSVGQYLMFYPFLSFVWLAPLVPLINYFLFFGEDVKVLLPKAWRRSSSRKTAHARPNANWANRYQSESGEKPYRHKCTVCGKTDTQYPDMEFRYCSQCKGYYCYCMEHINNHAHIQ